MYILIEKEMVEGRRVIRPEHQRDQVASTLYFIIIRSRAGLTLSTHGLPRHSTLSNLSPTLSTTDRDSNDPPSPHRNTNRIHRPPS